MRKERRSEGKKERRKKGESDMRTQTSIIGLTIKTYHL
jgi:hypothetical protein